MSTLNIKRNGGILNVSLARSHARNAINLAMCEEIVALFAGLQADEDLSLVIIRGEGPAFCAGVDMHEVKQHAQSSAWYVARRNLGLDAYLAIESCPAPVVTVVHGAAIGGGCEIVAAADFAWASDDAVFKYPEALFGAVGATQRLPRRVGTAVAKELLFTGRSFDAQEAQRIGLINRTMPRTELDQAVSRLSEEIASAEQTAVRLIKQAIDLGVALDLRSGVDVERQMIGKSVARPAWRAGADAFGRAVGSSTQ